MKKAISTLMSLRNRKATEFTKAANGKSVDKKIEGYIEGVFDGLDRAIDELKKKDN